MVLINRSGIQAQLAESVERGKFSFSYIWSSIMVSLGELSKMK